MEKVQEMPGFKNFSLAVFQIVSFLAASRKSCPCQVSRKIMAAVGIVGGAKRASISPASESSTAL